MKRPKELQPSKTLDLRGFSSPFMALRVRQALAEMPPGQALEVWLSSPQCARDLSCILSHTSDQCLLSQTLPQGFRLLLARRKKD